MADLPKEVQALNERMETKNLPWQDFEAEIFSHIKKEIKLCNLGLDPKTARAVSSPEYFSKLRETNIKFDVSIEVWPFAGADKPSILWIWECKNYTTRNVTVDEVEELNDKMKQVGAHKGTIATRKGFSSGAITLAKSYGIALVTLNKRQMT